MSVLAFAECGQRACLGFKGPRAGAWLLEQGIALPESPNSWVGLRTSIDDSGALIARLGANEFFLDADADVGPVRTLEAALASAPTGVYPVLREDAAFSLSGEAVHDVLAQVCSIDFARVQAASQVVIMTMMIGVAVLVVPDEPNGERRYRIWCDPSFGSYLGYTMGAVVMENGGHFTGVST